jgi:cyclase
MLKPRIIPCLLLIDGGIFKTQQFSNPKYIGEPLNAVRIFNEKEVDEILIIDISASRVGNNINWPLIKRLAAESRMPMCYGGGIKSVSDVEEIIRFGIEKVAIGAAAVMDPDIVEKASVRVGTQSIIVVIDFLYDRDSDRYEVLIKNGNIKTGLNPVDFAIQMEKLGAGEILLNSVDRDGMMVGYDVKLIRDVRSRINIPITALGGAGGLHHFKSVVNEGGNIGLAAGSMFVFKGKHRAVLLNYPSFEEKEELSRLVSGKII